MKYAIQTYGCAMNYSDSERVASVLERLGYVATQAANAQASQPEAFDSEADVLVLNTCSVKQKAEDRVYGLRKVMARLHKENPRIKIAVTGCMIKKTSTQKTARDEEGELIDELKSERDPILTTLPEVDIALRIEDVAKLPNLLQEVDPNLKFSDQLDEGTLENYFQIAPKKSTNYSVFVPITTGCDKFCTYCIVPFTRGREKSRDFDEILAECQKHVQEGAVEITLVGQTVNSYGLSFNDKKSGTFARFGLNAAGKPSSPFAALLREVDRLSEKGLKRLRFTSPHPRDFSDELIETLASLKTICPYIHMPVQSGDDAVLRRMNRNYRTPEYKEIMHKIKAAIPGCAISTDIIVGFCGETEEEFENTYKMYEEMEWDMCFLSRYSPRKGTYSQRTLPDDVSYDEKATRWHRLNDLLTQTAAKKHAAFLGKTVEVLVTEQIGQTCRGRTPEFKEIQFRSGRPLVGKFANVLVTETADFYLKGELA
ncbi:tRNA (N6-isopentenyl adenosine(37)-C2)-methylthiotransferase MiaB [Candidatus Peregrinibacteria bacterium]|nr:MAG: tRNA (N6-isopentenyl adenosine(37)-C2)-methylthiotransferase MiaB [Candidatus Peregrinibacteria bacterium]